MDQGSATCSSRVTCASVGPSSVELIKWFLIIKAIRKFHF